MRLVEFDYRDVRRIMRGLEVEDYCEGPLSDDKGRPHDLWVFGAYVVARAARWAFERSVMLVKGSLDWQTLWVEGLVLLGVLLPVAVLWLLVSGSSRALSLARWYAGLRAVLHFVSLLYPLVVGYGPESVSRSIVTWSERSLKRL